MEATTNLTNEERDAACQHPAEKHYMSGGALRCGSCFIDLDTSGCRPGLIEANQYR